MNDTIGAVIDLHTHSTASDGGLSPAALVKLASSRGVERLGLTDHDTISGLQEARCAANALGVSLVDGVEISACYGAMTVHILGLGIDTEHSGLQNSLSLSTRRRTLRGREIGARLEKAGINEAYERTRAIAGDGAIGRAHFARMLIDQGHAKDFKQVFRRFMVSGRPGYVPPSWMTMDQAVAVINASSGVAVLAHPAAYKLTTRKLKMLVGAFRECGGGAIEIVSGPSSADEITRLCRIANDHDLAGSTGSDFHGVDKPANRLGETPPLPANCSPVWERHPLW